MNTTVMRLCCLAVTLATSSAYAEHRVALLIGNNEYEQQAWRLPAHDMQSLADSLAKYGFRCKVVDNLNADRLKAAIEAFTKSTPTRGTALVYFGGQVLPGNYKGKPGTFLVATDAESADPKRIGSAGFSVETLLESMNAEGGSGTNIVLLDPADKLAAKLPNLPDDCFLAVGEATRFARTVTGTGNLLGELKAASSRNDTTLSANAEVAGKGSSVVGPPDRFVEGKRAGDEWVNHRGMVFCWCPSGEYIAGSPESEPGRYPDEKQRKVVIERGFWMSKYELTLRENLRNHPRNTIATHKNHPLTMINHDDAKHMTSRNYSADERKAGRLPADWEYTLPSEQQWEYAARAGTSTRFSFGDEVELLPRFANFGDKTYYDNKSVFSQAAHRTLDDGVEKLAVVGSYRPNAWGFHDMHGNVAEWCIDTAIRGGSWVSSPENCRSAFRDRFSSRNEQNFIGYRLVIQPVSSPSSNE